MGIAMKLKLFFTRMEKFMQVVRSVRLMQVLLRHHVLAGAEHRNVLLRDLATVVDIGANRGQFALAARQWAPKARVISFEPLLAPAEIFSRVFSEDNQVVLYQSAIGPESIKQKMHVSARDDSSSLLPISSIQTAIFPGTEEIGSTEVHVGPLEEFVTADDLPTPAMLKLDVQGFELEALRGCESLLNYFEWVYCECSFVELYSGQKLAWEVIEWLFARDFCLMGMFNPAYDDCGQAVQADFLFRRVGGLGLEKK
jgi:FkbM family methyltransferase